MGGKLGGGQTGLEAGDYGIKDRTDRVFCKVAFVIENRPMGNVVGV